MLLGNVSLVSCTISGNTAGFHGGGIFVDTDISTVTLTNTIVSRNTTNGNPDDIQPTVGGGALGGHIDLTSSFNLIGSGGGLTNGVNGNIVGVNDPKLVPLANNGGPTQTMALLSNSPAIEKGKSFGLITDQRGFTRPVQQDHILYPLPAGGDGSDIGAFELGPLPAIDGISPASMPQNSGVTTISVTGVNYVSGSTVQINGSPRVTTVVDSQNLTVALTAADKATVGAQTVQVINPGSITSNVALLTILPNNICGEQTINVAAGDLDSARVLPTGPASGCAINGVIATLNRLNSTGSSETLSVASYLSNPTGASILDVGGGFLDLKVTPAGSKDEVDAFFYYPSTITGTNETNLHLLYFDGTKWQAVKSSGGASPVQNTTDNQNATVSGGTFAVIFNQTSTPQVTQLTGTVFTFSTFVPTAVDFDSATVTNIGNENLIEWNTGFEVNNLGFNVYRQTGGERVKINPSLIAGTALMVGNNVRVEAGNGYSWLDNNADGSASYWLEDVDLNGSSVWHGPYGVTVSARAGSSRARSTLLSDLNKSLSKQNPAAVQREYPAGLTTVSNSVWAIGAVTSGRSPNKRPRSRQLCRSSGP